MLETQSTENTASDQTAANDQQPTDYLSIRLKAREERIKASLSPDSTQNEPTTDAAPAAQETVLSKLMKELEAVPLDDLPESEVRALAEKLRSKSVSRFADLSKKAKTAEAQLAEILQEREKGFVPQAKAENNPFASIETVEALDQEFQRASGHVEWAEGLLEDREGSHPEEVIYTDAAGKEYTKAQIKQSLRDARKARDVHIGEQYKQIMTKEQRKVQRTLVAEKAAKELPWLVGDDNDTRRQYESLKAGVRITEIEKADPEFAVHLDRILAHAANSMFSAQKASASAKPPAALKPPSTPSHSGAAPQRANPNADKFLQEAEARFQKTQSEGDYLAVLRARRAARQQAA